MPTKTSFWIALCLLSSMAFTAHSEIPKNLDFVGGYFEDGVYKCYADPCFSIHKDAYPAANNIRFNHRSWPFWLDLDENCQKENQQMLAYKSEEPVTYLNNDPCEKVTSGKWTDPYSGQIITDIEQITVEHRVSLQEAHYFGGASWPRNKRALFANDPRNLVVVSKEQKQARRALPANKWMPDNKKYWCDYVVHREIIFRKFNLRLPDAEAEFNKKTKKLYCKY